jgi:5-methyltetrahydrofolate--homocysteine methyltransferase
LPARELVNASFLSLAAAAGMNACIANPGNARIAEAVDAVNLLLGHDVGAERFIGRYANWSGSGKTPSGGASPAPTSSGGAGSAAPSGSIEEAVIAGRRDRIEELVRAALDAGEDAFAIVGERLIPAITEVGGKYERKEYFLPQLIRSAETMQAAFALLRPLLEKDSRATSRPVVIMATVEGDIHDIGKNIVNLMLGNHGFDVVDLGKDVAAPAIVEAARERGARLIGLSALMTTTMVRMRETVDLLRDRHVDAGGLVGGAGVTKDFARSIGAHYAKDAVDAVRLARNLLQGEV